MTLILKGLKHYYGIHVEVEAYKGQVISPDSAYNRSILSTDPFSVHFLGLQMYH